MNEGALQTIPQAQADEATREIYADIGATMGVAIVNLVWRHLALKPAVLVWSWKALKPHYASAAIPAAAWQLREAVNLRSLRPLATTEWNRLACETEDLALVDAVLRSYERGNAQNLVAMCHLKRLLDPAREFSSAPDVSVLTASQLEAERADRLKTPLPPLPDWEGVGSHIREQLGAMAQVWVPEQYRGLIPSVFRHLAHWPGILLVLAERLTELRDSDGDLLFSLYQAAQLQAEKRGNELGAAGAHLPTLSVADREWLNDALDMFICGMISPGVVIVPAMRGLLAERSEPQS